MYRFVNFKGFADVTLDLDVTPVTLLIGRNGSGKSNAIEAIELLAQLLGGIPLHEVTDVGRGGKFELRGGLAGCAHGEHSSFSLGLTSTHEDLQVEYEVEIRVKPKRGDPPGPSIWREVVQVGGEEVFRANHRGVGSLRVRYLGTDGARKQANTRSDVSPLSQLFHVAGDRASDDLYAAYATALASTPTGHVFDPYPEAMRHYERTGQTTLARNGSNLGSVLHGLSHGSSEQRETLDQLARNVQELPEEPFRGFGFVTTEAGDVLFGLLRGKRLVDARVLSDGTLRALAVLVALETGERGARVVVEEFDNGVHPSRAGLLMETAWRAASDRGCQVLATTHDPATMNALKPEQLRGVVVCHWDDAARASTMTRLTELPLADEALELGALGELVADGTLARFLDPKLVEKRTASGQRWLDKLRTLRESAG